MLLPVSYMLICSTICVTFFFSYRSVEKLFNMFAKVQPFCYILSLCFQTSLAQDLDQ